MKKNVLEFLSSFVCVCVCVCVRASVCVYVRMCEKTPIIVDDKDTTQSLWKCATVDQSIQ